MSTPTMVRYDPYSPEAQYNPYPIWRALRDHAPVYHNPDYGFYALTRYEDVSDAILDPATYISSQGNNIEGMTNEAGFLIWMDPPEHRWYRKLLARVFTPRHVAGLEPFIRDVAAGYLDRARTGGRFDLVRDYSLRLPLDVIGELLGIPADLRPTIADLSTRSVVRSDDSAATAGMPGEDAVRASFELRMLLLELVAHRRRNPRDDIISMLIDAEVTDDEGNTWRMDDDQIAAQFHLLAFAGHETVTKLIGNGAVALHWYPDHRRALAGDPKLIPNAVEEMLRWDNPAPIAGRVVTRDVTLHGTTIPEGSRVLLLLGSANHDDRVYEEPELFDIHRVIGRPLVFGLGIHLCLGAALARLEARVAFEELLARYPEYALDEPNVERGPAAMFRGLARLPVFTNA